MSVLIKGLEMPNDCGECFVGDRTICHDKCPLVEVPLDEEPVKRGMWTFIRLTDKDWGHKAKECSSCGSTFFDTRQWNYCPNCGADMRGESDE